MITRFDHCVIGVRDLDGAMALWRDRLGFDVRPGGRHTGRGTYNALVRFGLDYIELISIYSHEELEQRNEGNAKALARALEQAEAGMLGFALATDDIAAEARRCQERGFDAAGPFEMQRMRPDNRLLKWRLLVPRPSSWGTPWPFFIQWDLPDEERLAWEQPGAHANTAAAIEALAITIANLEEGVRVYHEVLGLPLVSRDEVPDLSARRASFRTGHTRLDLLSPTGEGAVADAVRAGQEQPFQLTLAVRDLELARRELAARGVELWPAPGTSGGWLIAPHQALECRLVLVEGGRG